MRCSLRIFFRSYSLGTFILDMFVNIEKYYAKLNEKLWFVESSVCESEHSMGWTNFRQNDWNVDSKAILSQTMLIHFQ